jgi:hypothetical protein
MASLGSMIRNTLPSEILLMAVKKHITNSINNDCSGNSRTSATRVDSSSSTRLDNASSNSRATLKVIIGGPGVRWESVLLQPIQR